MMILPVELICGEAMDALEAMEGASVDALVTDPPAGIAFMGREWDRSHGGRAGWVEATAPIFAECLRVLKPGAHGLVWALPRTSHWTATALEDAGFEIRDKGVHLFGSGFPKSLDVSKAMDKVNGETGRLQWDGWGTALKPAAEDWWLVRKPLIGTVAANVEANGTGALNVDGCRIPTEDKWNLGRAIYGGVFGTGKPVANPEGSPLGRWPANVTLDEDAAAMLDEAAGDDGGASRFFYTAKASPSERSLDVDGRNTHPTVKPVDLMRWLIRLVTPPGGVVLDPFMGTGTTGVACRAEGFGFYGIEREAESYKTAQQRLAQTAMVLE